MLVPISIFIETICMSYGRTVSEIFSVKKRRDLKTGGRGPSRSLKMEPIDTSYRFLYFYLVPFLSYLTLNNIVTLKYGLDVFHDHSNWFHSKAWVRFLIHLP